MNYIGDIVDEFIRWFDLFNEKYFNSTLEQPIFTIQKARKGNYGHFTLTQVWQGKTDYDSPNYEINIAAGTLHRNVSEIAGTLLHEMIHLFFKVNNIKDCSGQIHNKKFKAKAEEFGFIVERSKSRGWGHTYIDGELEEFIENEVKPKEEIFKYARIVFEDDKDKEKKIRKKTSFKFICPFCRTTAKAKENANLMCGACQCGMNIEY